MMIASSGCQRTLLFAFAALLIAHPPLHAQETTADPAPEPLQIREADALQPSPVEPSPSDVPQPANTEPDETQLAPAGSRIYPLCPPADFCQPDPRIYRSVLLGRLWVEGEYLAWASRGTELPTLLTTSPAGTAAAAAGVLGEPGTRTLFGNEEVHDTLRSGFGLTIGYWFTPNHLAGLEARLIGVQGEDIDFRIASDDRPILARPIIDRDASTDASILVAFPGLQEGDVRIRSDTQLFGAEALYREAIGCDGQFRLDYVAGYRYLRLFDRLRYEDAFLSLDPVTGFDVDSVVFRFDRFMSENEFHGGELGLISRWSNQCWAVQLLGKVAIGGTRTTTTIDGRTVEITSTDERNSVAGGGLALPSNIGEHSQTKSAAIGELGVRLEYSYTPQLRFMFGYNYLHWSSVARVLDTIDSTVDRSQLPPGTDRSARRPDVDFQNTTFWTHGLTAGVHYEF